MPIRLHQTNGEIDRGMIRHVEKKNLRGSDQQRAFDARRLRRQAAIEKEAEHMPQRAEPAQHDADQGAGERAVAILERGEFAVEQFVERAAAAQHAVDNIGRDPADREAGHLGGGRDRGFARALHCEKIPS